jgi:hypothetical protein
MKTNFLKKIKNNRVILLILIVFVLVIILIKKSIEKFTNIDDCSSLEISVCSTNTECNIVDNADYKCCLPNGIQPDDHIDICERAEGDVWTGGGGQQNNSTTTTTTEVNTSTTTTTTKPATTTTTTTKPTTTTTKPTTTTTKPTTTKPITTTTTTKVNKDKNNISEEEQISNQDVIVDEESFMPVFSEAEYNIYQGPYYGFGNLFVPDTEIYNK